MMFNSFYGNRNFTNDTHIENGKITIKEKGFKEIVTIVDRQVTELKIIKNGKFTYWIKYGEFEKERKNGITHKILRFKNTTGKGKDGLCIRKDFKLEGYKGTCYTFFANGRLMWQKFVYPNGKVAYYARSNAKEIIAVRPDGTPLFRFEGEKFNFKGNGYGEPLIYNEGMYNSWTQAQKWNLSKTKCAYTFYDKRGRAKNKGQYENNQRIGEWTENYKTYFFISGVKVNKKLFEMPSDKVDPYRVLREPNAQARSMLLKKIGYERVVKKCKGVVIHVDKKRKNSLIDFPMKTDEKHYRMNDQYTKEEDEYDQCHLRILQVTCTSTKSKHFIRVPALPDWNTSEKARQGTFNGYDKDAKNINFERET